jgi:hypothetical protein
MRALYPRFVSCLSNTWSTFGVGALEVYHALLTASLAEWQGMELLIPWDRENLNEGSQKDLGLLTTHQRLPPEVEVLRDPMLWEEEEVSAW